jgi:hypothetical protein
MLLGFKRRFVPFILDGTKTHTIRAKRKVRPRPGEMCHCYVDPRQKTMALLGRWRCTRIDEIVIDRTGDDEALLAVTINGARLTPAEADLFFYRDGFRDRGTGQFPHIRQAAAFWARQNFPFVGDLIHWQFEERA